MRKRLKTYPDYAADEQGNIWSYKLKTNGHKLRATPNPEGRLRLKVHNYGQKPKTVTVHKLVAEAFLGPKPKGLVIRHLDGNKLNNCADNLAYGTPFDNYMDDISNNKFILTIKNIEMIRNPENNSIEAYRILAKKLNVTYSNIQAAATGRSFKFLNEKFPPHPKRPIKRTYYILNKALKSANNSLTTLEKRIKKAQAFLKKSVQDQKILKKKIATIKKSIPKGFVQE